MLKKPETIVTASTVDETPVIDNTPESSQNEPEIQDEQMDMSILPFHSDNEQILNEQ